MNILNMTKKIAKNVVRKIAKKKPEITYTPVDPKEDFFVGADPVKTPDRSRGSMTLSYRGDRGWYVPVDMDASAFNGDRMVMLADSGEVGSYLFDNGRWVPA